MSLSNGSTEGANVSGHGGNSSAEGSYTTGGSSSLGGGSSQTSSSTNSSSAYLTEDGKVEKHILDQIAGLNAGE